MPSPSPRAPRGRPPTITHARIADAGIQVGLPNITFVGLAAAMGVSHMALYKHVPSLEALKHLVADEMFSRWRLPLACRQDQASLEAYLVTFSVSVREFVKLNPGVTPYVIRRLAASPPMLEKIRAHQQHIADAFALPLAQSRWLLETVAFHGMAVADTVYTVAGREPAVSAQRAAEEAEMEVELDRGMQALIVGCLATLKAGVKKNGSSHVG